MNIPVTPPIAPEWSPDVLELAREAQVQTYLEPIRQATWQVFPTARRVRATVAVDPEIHGERTIVFEVALPYLPVEEAVAAEWRWCGEVLRLCPAQLAGPFCLLLEPDNGD